VISCLQQAPFQAARSGCGVRHNSPSRDAAFNICRLVSQLRCTVRPCSSVTADSREMSFPQIQQNFVFPSSKERIRCPPASKNKNPSFQSNARLKHQDAPKSAKIKLDFLRACAATEFLYLHNSFFVLDYFEGFTHSKRRSAATSQRQESGAAPGMLGSRPSTYRLRCQSAAIQLFGRSKEGSCLTRSPLQTCACWQNVLG
jgi:hypothetical protein